MGWGIHVKLSSRETSQVRKGVPPPTCGERWPDRELMGTTAPEMCASKTSGFKAEGQHPQGFEESDRHLASKNNHAQNNGAPFAKVQ